MCQNNDHYTGRDCGPASWIKRKCFMFKEMVGLFREELINISAKKYIHLPRRKKASNYTLAESFWPKGYLTVRSTTVQAFSRVF